MSYRKQQPSSSSDKTTAQLLKEYVKNIDEWPGAWEIDQADLIIGAAILVSFKLFLLDRIEKGRAKKTIKMYASYLWVLGGELIRQVNDNPRERKLTTQELILKYVDDSGGPYWRHASDELEHQQYDSVCKQLFKFLTETG